MEAGVKSEISSLMAYVNVTRQLNYQEIIKVTDVTF